MTKKEKYSLAKWAMNHALENGAQQVSVSISNSRSSSVEVREQKIDKLEQAIQSSLFIRLFVDNKYSAHSTNRLKKEELARFIEEAIAGTRYLSEDEFRTLPDPELYYKGGAQSLNTLDTNFDAHNPQEKIDLAFDAEKEVLGKDERIISVTASYYDGLSERVMVASNGFEGDTANSYYGLNAQVSVKGGDARPESYWSENAIFFNELEKKGIGEKALERAINKIGQKKTDSGKMSMIVENRTVARLFSPLISALSGSAIQQKNSFLIDKQNEKVFSDKLTVIDDPFVVSGRGSRLFDSEGLATKKRPVFENGVLKNYFIDTYYAKKLDMQPTSGSNTNLVFKPGDKNLKQLVASVDRGILVTGFNGGNCNGATGDFSYGIEGFLIEKGQISQPVSEMNITGNMKELWAGIGEVGNDVNKNSSWLIPSIVFEGVDFSGA
ncbi:PmbA protein [Mariniphaga anaerophila]|uniref:PmbA protein n=1 Tax=Mariniphaga anaerophila TaxID=1484053 RepID=A0A1M5A521_9BACT|nr:TldD/PmbA family protein [Mariniphaga anaerophila]SHF25409.1 PmbA protein [Mariniphaga anaerophila]